MTRPEFAGLFAKADIEAAEWRLAKVAKPKADGPSSPPEA
jgi:hypothetical protein